MKYNIFLGFHVAGTNLPQAPSQHSGYHTGAALVHNGGHGLYHGPHAAIGHDGKLFFRIIIH